MGRINVSRMSISQAQAMAKIVKRLRVLLASVGG